MAMRVRHKRVKPHPTHLRGSSVRHQTPVTKVRQEGQVARRIGRRPGVVHAARRTQYGVGRSCLVHANSTNRHQPRRRRCAQTRRHSVHALFAAETMPQQRRNTSRINRRVRALEGIGDGSIAGGMVMVRESTRVGMFHPQAKRCQCRVRNVRRNGAGVEPKNVFIRSATHYSMSAA